MATIFTQIINGDIPCHKVYEDDYAFAFMDIYPIQTGHVTVVSKKEVGTFEQLEEEDYQGLMAAIQKIAIKIKEVIRPVKVGVIIEGFEVPHAHAKILPINSEHELRHMPDTDKEPDHDALAAMAERLKIE